MQTTAIGTVANSLPESEVISLTLLISKRYILFAELQNKPLHYNNVFKSLTRINHKNKKRSILFTGWSVAIEIYFVT